MQKTNAVKHVNGRSIMLWNEATQSEAAVMGSKAAYQAFTRQNNTDVGKITDVSYSLYLKIDMQSNNFFLLLKHIFRI